MGFFDSAFGAMVSPTIFGAKKLGLLKSTDDEANALQQAGEQPGRPGYIDTTNGAAYQALQKEGLQAPGTVSPWMAAQRGASTIDYGTSLQKGREAANQQSAQAANSMAARGGLSGGARERLLQNRNQIAAANNAAAGQQYQKGLLGIDSTGEQNRLQSLGAASQMEQGAAQAHNAYNSDVYGQDMKAWGANKLADQQAKAALTTGGLLGGGGILGSGLKF